MNATILRCHRNASTELFSTNCGGCTYRHTRPMEETHEMCNFEMSSEAMRSVLSFVKIVSDFQKFTRETDIQTHGYDGNRTK
jgi:hypothetical protein